MAEGAWNRINAAYDSLNISRCIPMAAAAGGSQKGSIHEYSGRYRGNI